MVIYTDEVVLMAPWVIWDRRKKKKKRKSY